MKKLIKRLNRELEECPFCKQYNLGHSIDGCGGFIECDSCNATGPFVEPYHDIDKAIEAWNDRLGKP